VVNTQIRVVHSGNDMHMENRERHDGDTQKGML
jgi:hypothetical protein